MPSRRNPHRVLNGEKQKECSSCKIYFPLDKFNKQKDKWDGLRSQCKGCLQKYRHANKERTSTYHKARAKRLMSTEEGREYLRQKARRHSKKRIKSGKLAAYMRKKRKNPVFAEQSRISCHFYQWEKRNGGKHKKRSHKYLGCTIEQYHKHMQSLFVEGMSLENRSEWHADHRVPLAAFDAKDEEQVKIVWYFKNIQPLWAKDNLSKNDTYQESDKIALIELYNKDHGTQYMQGYLQNYYLQQGCNSVSKECR